jgi:hypothetical protein
MKHPDAQESNPLGAGLVVVPQEGTPMRISVAILTLAIAFTTTPARAETPAELTERLLSAGNLAESDSALSAILKAHPDDSEARFGLGVTRFLRAVERLAQSFHRHGLRSGILGNGLPFARLPIPPNPKPEPIRYPELRNIMQALTDDLAKSESTLALIGDKEVKLPLHFGRIRLDLDGDGKAEPDERLWKLYLMLNQVAQNQVTDAQCEAFVIAFDRGDVAWLRGYCHLLMAFTEAYLAYDGQELFDYSAPMFFPEAATPFPFLRRGHEAELAQWDTDTVLDAVAMIHAIRLPVKEPERMKTALAHLESMIALSHESWRFILAETDNDHEWVPSPKQESVLPGVTVNIEMVKGWMIFLNEAEAILKGKMLIPFWRKGEDRGVNLRRVFTEPGVLDLILWVQGTAAAPYLEKGPQTRPETWRRLQNVFRGEFVGFAVWFN